MVFPSLACLTCKKRRKKCDLVHPCCTPCNKGNHQCLWSVENSESIPFRSENDFARGQPRRPRRVHGHARASLTNPTPWRPTIAYAPSLPLDIHALNYWMESFAFGVDDVMNTEPEYSSCITLHWRKTSSDSSLHLALSTLTHAIFGHAKQVDKAIEKAHGFYCRAVTKLHTELKNVANQEIDKFLITTMLLGSYESIMRGLAPYKSRSFLEHNAASVQRCQRVCHYQGALGLLRLRKRRSALPNERLDRAVRLQLIRTIILGGKPVPAELRDPLYAPADPKEQLDQLLFRFARLRAKSTVLFGAEESTDVARAIAAEAQDLDFAFLAWSETVPESWKFSISTEPEIPMSDVRGLMHTQANNSLENATVWNQYRALRLALNSIHLRSLDTLSRCPADTTLISWQQVICRDQISAISNDLCDGLQFCLNAGKGTSGKGELLTKVAFLVAWPLTLANSSESIPEPQRGTLHSMMKIVTSTLGDAALGSLR